MIAPGLFKKIVLFVVATITVLSLVTVFLFLGPPSVNEDWQYREFANDLTKVSALSVDDTGSVYALLEEKAGKLIRLTGKSREILMDDLHKPDGITRLGDNIIITEEVSKGRVIQYSPRSDTRKTLTTLDNAEGVDIGPDGNLYIVEDLKQGELIRLQPDGSKSVLLQGLREPEGVCVNQSGDILIAEKLAGDVLRLRGDSVSVYLQGLHKPDFIKCDPDGSLWITEDKTNFGRLLHFRDGRLNVIAARLRSPQGIAITRSGELLLAEQGRNRILAFSSLPR